MPSQAGKARAEGLLARGFDEAKLDGERIFYARLESEILGGTLDELIVWMLQECARLFPEEDANVSRKAPTGSSKTSKG